MIEEGLTRQGINARINRIKRVFRWAVSEELAPATLVGALSTVAGLEAGRTVASETEPVTPVSDEVVEKTLPHLPNVVADMVRFQRLVGCRPGEVCAVRPGDVDRSGKVWRDVPGSHKTEHYGKQRIIFVGPRAQRVLLPYLLREAQAYCFSPADSDRERKAEMRTKRKTKVQPSQVDRTKEHAKRKPGMRYNTGTIVVGATRRFTSVEALERFVGATTAVANDEPIPMRTPRQRERAIERAEQDLARDQ